MVTKPSTLAVKFERNLISTLVFIQLIIKEMYAVCLYLVLLVQDHLQMYKTRKIVSFWCEGY